MATEKPKPETEAVVTARAALEQASQIRDAIEEVQETTRLFGNGPERDLKVAALELATANEAKASAALAAALA